MRLELEETTDNCAGEKKKREDFQLCSVATETRVCDLMELMDSFCKQEENVSGSSSSTESAAKRSLPYSLSDTVFIAVS